jgi:hypothetical protein
MCPLETWATGAPSRAGTSDEGIERMNELSTDGLTMGDAPAPASELGRAVGIVGPEIAGARPAPGCALAPADGPRAGAAGAVAATAATAETTISSATTAAKSTAVRRAEVAGASGRFLGSVGEVVVGRSRVSGPR